MVPRQTSELPTLWVVQLSRANGTVDIDDMQLWGGGIVQEVDAAAMSVWVKYRHMSLDTTVERLVPGMAVEDFQYVGVGGLINF